MNRLRINFVAGLFLLLLLVGNGCSNEGDSIKLFGTYTEVSPQPDRTTLKFSAGNKVTMTDIVSSALPESYDYSISGNKITLTLVGDPLSKVELEFGITNGSEFWIENMYPSIPEAPKVKMVFRK